MKPIAFTAFVALLGVNLTPAQRVFCLVAFDGLEPRGLEGDDRELARQLFGDVDEITALVRAVIVAVCGARSGKTYLAALRLLHLSLTVSLAHPAAGEWAFALFVAPDMRLAGQGLRYALGAAQSVPAIGRLIEDDSAAGFTIARPDGYRVRFEALPASRGGSAVRGRNLVGAVLDECAFFRGEDSVVNDIEVYRAVAPRVMPGGQLLPVSTPWTETGLLFDLFTLNHGHPTTALAVHAPTTLMRDDDHTRSMVERERANDPVNALREFDAQFVPGAGSQLLDPAAFDACIVDDSPLSLPRPEQCSIAAAGDLGLRADASALAIVARKSDLFALLHVDEIRPSKGAPLKPSEVCAAFALQLKRYGIRRIHLDSFYIEAAREHFAEHSIAVDEAPAGQAGKIAVHMASKTIIHEGRLMLPPHRNAIEQLKAIRVKPMAGGGTQISSPRRAGAHGDVASAIVLALWAANELSGSGWVRRIDDGDRKRLPNKYAAFAGNWSPRGGIA